MGYGPLWGRYSLHYASPFALSCFICEKRGRTKKRLDIVSLYDMCYAKNATFKKELWDEKITDSLNYLFLLAAIIREEAAYEQN